MFDFTTQQREWSQIPVDDVGYLSPATLLAQDDDEFGWTVRRFELTRYNRNAIRNYQNKWRDYLGLDTTSGKVILDFGCGVGIESLQFAKRCNQVILADINQSSLDVAKRTLGVYGYMPIQSVLVSDKHPFFSAYPYDIFYCNGVLHHIPYAREILKRAVEDLSAGGEIRLMLYSDKGWVGVTGTDLPSVGHNIEHHTAFNTFVKYFDSIGTYADWYNKEKLEFLFGDFLKVKFFDYIRSDDYYCVAILEKK